MVDNAFSAYIDSVHRPGDIRDQSLKLSEIARNFGRFLPFKILWMRAPKVAPVFSCLPRGTSRGKVS